MLHSSRLRYLPRGCLSGQARPCCIARHAVPLRAVAVPRATTGGSAPEQHENTSPGGIRVYPLRLGNGKRLRSAKMDWNEACPTQMPAAIQAYNEKTPYPVVDLWLHEGLSGWAPVQLRLVFDSKDCYVLKCLHSDADVLGLEEGDSLGLLALQPGGPLMVIAACTPTGELKTGGALGGAGGAAAGVRAGVAAVAAARSPTPPPPAFTAAYSISQQQQQAGGSSEVSLEVTLPSLADMGAGGSGAAGVQEPADQQRMTLLFVQVQPHHDPHSLRPKAHDMQSTPCPVTWQRQAGGDGASSAGGAVLRGLPAALLPELPPQGRLLVLPAQSLAVLVAAPTQATTALAAAGAPAVAAKPHPPQVSTAAAASSSAASSSTASSSASASGHSTIRARASATPPPLASPPLLALFTVGGPVEGADAGGLLQLVAEESLQWEALMQAWGLALGWMKQQRWRQRQAVEVCLPQLVPSTAAASGEPSLAVRWPRVPMWLLAAGPDARGAGDDSSGLVLCCRSEALHVLGLQPGDRLALHPEGPGRVFLVVPPSRGNASCSLAGSITQLPTAAATHKSGLQAGGRTSSITFDPQVSAVQLQQAIAGSPGGEQSGVAQWQSGIRVLMLQPTNSSSSSSAADNIRRLQSRATCWVLLAKAAQTRKSTAAAGSSSGSGGGSGSTGGGSGSASCEAVASFPSLQQPLILHDPSASARLCLVKLQRPPPSSRQQPAAAGVGAAASRGDARGRGLLDDEAAWWSVAAARPLEAGDLLAFVGGRVVLAASLQSGLLMNGLATGALRPELRQELRRRCQPRAAAAAAADGAATDADASVDSLELAAALEAAWALLGTVHTWPYTWSPLRNAGGDNSGSSSSSSASAAGGTSQLHLVLMSPDGCYGGGVVGLVNDPAFRPAWVAELTTAAAGGTGGGGVSGAEANCMVVGVQLAPGDAVVPLLVATRRLEAGEHLLLDRGPDWREQVWQLVAALRRMSGGAAVAKVLFGSHEKADQPAGSSKEYEERGSRRRCTLRGQQCCRC